MPPRGDKTKDAKITELTEALARSERTVRALRDVGLALGSTLDLDQLLELILTRITELLEGDRATLYLLDEQRGRLSSRIMVGDEARSIELPIGEGIAGYVAKYGRTVRIKDAYRDKRFQRTWDEVTGYKTRAILAAPMKNHVGRTIGVIQVLNKNRGEGEFSQYDEELLTALATQAAVSIDNSRLFLSVIQKNMQLVETKEQLERRVADLKLLFELEAAMSGATAMEELAGAVAAEAAQAADARVGAVIVDEHEAGVFLYMVDRTDAPLFASESHGPRDARAAVRRAAVKRNEGIIGWAMMHGEAVSFPQDFSRISGEGDAGPVSARIGNLLGTEVTTAVAVPLDGEGDETIGAIAIYNSNKPTGFSQDDRAMLRLISANASTAVRLFRSRIERERSERLTTIGRLLSGVMHDMRTPLTVISGYVQLMVDAADHATRADHAKLILKQFDLLSSMQREVLEFARGERSILVRKVYLTKFFEDIEKQLAREIEGTDVTLTIDLADRGTARFDESKMTRVLHNLARNAVEAMTPVGSTRGGKLTIRVSRENNALVIAVSDTGRGIPKEVQDRLFQSFATSGKRGGTGLGLAIVKKIIDEHGGTIRATSSSAGATFTIHLPQEVPISSGGSGASSGSATPAASNAAPVQASTEAGPKRRSEARQG